MIKNFLTKKFLDYKLKDIPEDQKKMVMDLMEKNPELFEKIAKETDQRIKQGEGQMKASISVMKKYQNELREVLSSTDLK